MWVVHRLLRSLLLLSWFLLLGGCAQSWSARVLQFEQWPTDSQGAQYVLDLSAEQQSSLEFQAVADAVRSALGQVGLSEGAVSSARFSVTIDFENPLKRKWVQRYMDPMF